MVKILRNLGSYYFFFVYVVIILFLERAIRNFIVSGYYAIRRLILDYCV
jgi:hypothetical protein